MRNVSRLELGVPNIRWSKKEKKHVITVDVIICYQISYKMYSYVTINLMACLLTNHS